MLEIRDENIRADDFELSRIIAVMCSDLFLEITRIQLYQYEDFIGT